VLVVGEIRHGVELLKRRGDVAQADAIDAWLVSLTRMFADRLVPISAAVAEAWGRLNAERPVPVVDGLMAATAIEHDLTLVTRDTATLVGTGVRVLDPWS
jgi:predicted nucleic acid-binding protein